MKQFSFSIPQSICVGPGTLSELTRAAGELGGKHAFLISGPSLYRSGLVERAMSCLAAADIPAEYFTEVEANPSVTTVDKATEAFLESGADFIVALGGGSPMDVAKAVAVLAKYSGSITEYEGAHKVPGKVIPMIAIPTTAGTGSEVTAFSVITDHARNYKLTVFSYELLPAYVILDPELIATVPSGVAAACGIDALIHAQEAYVSRAASPFSETMSEKAMELIGASLRPYVANRKDSEAAANMLIGSLFAGIAFSYARLGNIHAMSHPISAYFDVPHGVANGSLLPVILKYNALADQGKYLKIYNYISPVKKTAEQFKPMMLVDAARELLRDIGIPEGILAAVRSVKGKENVTGEEIEKLVKAMAADAYKSGNIAVNPRSSTLAEIEQLYYDAIIP